MRLRPAYSPSGTRTQTRSFPTAPKAQPSPRNVRSGGRTFITLGLSSHRSLGQIIGNLSTVADSDEHQVADSGAAKGIEPQKGR